MFDWEYGIALQPMQGNPASTGGKGEVSSVFSSCGRNLGYILELWRVGHSKLEFVQRRKDFCLVTMGG